MLRDEGTSREEVGRKEFLRRTWQWKEKYSGHIQRQIRRIGASCDWDRERFTLDEGLSQAVREAFVRLYEKGLIYRGEYLINWSPGLQTAVSDLEVEYHEEQGTLYYFKYPVADSDDFLSVATTRPETILGDTAIAVHPNDERYQKFVGKTCWVPILNRPIPIIADTYVDMTFGTGALKVTPGHDPNDFELGRRHNLPIINIMNKNAVLNKNAGPYVDLDRFEARKKLWADMEKLGLTIKTKPHLMQVPRSQRGCEIIEPLVSTQWFMNMKPLADRALEVVRNGQIRIIPEHFTKVYNHWLENIRDWCISRQLWWGHRIPVWYCQKCDNIIVAREDPTSCKCGSTELRQDPDVLDTWFSSGLWPFSTLGWPNETEDLERFYPTDVMETGYDILFFWVARMIMQGLECTDKIPFHTVYLHGLVRDEHGKKMSKSYGNVVDPIDVMDKYGTDALRFTLLTGSTPGNDMNISLERVAGNRNFSNKIWNATRFVVNNLGIMHNDSIATINLSTLTLADRWIMSRHNRLVQHVTRLMDSFNFGEAGRQTYDFFWNEYADWFIEISKIRLKGKNIRAQTTVRRVLVYVLDRTLRLLHPFIPFVTEAAWQHIPHHGESLCIAHWPIAGQMNDEAESQMNIIIAIVRAIRNVRATYKVEPGKYVTAIIVAGEHVDLITEESHVINHLARLDESTIQITDSLQEKPRQALTAIVEGGIEIYLPLSGLIDVAVERQRLESEIADLEKRMERSEKQLANENFVSRAPAHIVENERTKLADLTNQASKLHGLLVMLTNSE